MTREEAIAEAAKREKNKSKHMTHKVWRAVEVEDGVWKPQLIDNPRHVLQQGMKDARDIFFGGGTVGEFHAVAEKMLLARCQLTIDQIEGADQTRQ